MLADAEGMDHVTETLQRPVADAMAPNLGTGPALVDTAVTEASPTCTSRKQSMKGTVQLQMTHLTLSRICWKSR